MSASVSTQATTERTFFQSNLQAPDLGAFVDPFKKAFEAYRLVFLSEDGKKDTSVSLN